MELFGESVKGRAREDQVTKGLVTPVGRYFQVFETCGETEEVGRTKAGGREGIGGGGGGGGG